MPKLTIDNKLIEVEEGTTVLKAALNNGIKIPYFCWHPALTISGNCRMCLVEIEKMPKLMISCQTIATEGMVVHTNTERVIKAQHSVMEFLLINHPLDCPICDEAGQCKLQDYAFNYSIGKSRFDEDKNEKRKRDKIGPYVIFDAERCISCSRCIRFCDEVAKKPQLTFVNRGDRVTIECFPGQKLDNPYSMNTIDICPVGALTSADFRFKSRVWEMSFTDSICIGCSRGCNIKIGVRNNEILRLEPRENLDVNRYWMCDYGRLETFRHVSDPTRIKSPMVKRNGKFFEVGWDEAIAKVASELKNYHPDEIYGFGSAFASNEDNYIFHKFLTTILKTSSIDYISHVDPKNEDDILVRANKSPNERGVQELGITPINVGSNLYTVIKAINERKIKVLYVMNDDIFSVPELAEAASNMDLIISHATNENRTTKISNIVLPCSTFAEINGTFVNFQGRVQRASPAVATLERDRTMDLYNLSRLDKFGTQFDRWNKSNKRDSRPNWKIIKKIAFLFNAKWEYELAEDVFIEISHKVKSFKGLSYEVLGEKGTLLKMQ
jgi:NADH-quinone oxidoreductase subunit G